jgi:hypothetical protein
MILCVAMYGCSGLREGAQVVRRIVQAGGQPGDEIIDQSGHFPVRRGSGVVNDKDATNLDPQFCDR